MSLNTTNITFIGHSYDEYCRMFGLSEELLKVHNLLDCPAGAGSFVAECHQKGFLAKAVDPLYSQRETELKRHCEQDMGRLKTALSKPLESINWGYYGNKENLLKKREEAARLFLEDFQKRDDHYIAASLPERLPFEDNSFSIVLCSHFLFVSDETKPLEFYLGAIEEMLRVASDEIRVCPLRNNDGQPFTDTGALLESLNAKGHRTVLVPSHFEFQKGVNKYLRILKKKG